MASILNSSICQQAHLESANFLAWAERMREPFKLHRKLWEFCFIAQALHERGMLQPGRRGLGFAVGREPLPALFASLGCEIVATDQDEQQARQAGWADTNQHATSRQVLNERNICPADLFDRNVSFRVADMNAIPADLHGFDFVWSSCAFEHLGTLEHGLMFMRNMLRVLRPGGVAVHTTEFNLSSDTVTVTSGNYVIFRRRDIEKMAADLRRQGCRINLDYSLGGQPGDCYVDPPPYQGAVHLRLLLNSFVSTSIGLIAETGDQPATRWQRLSRWWTTRKAG